MRGLLEQLAEIQAAKRAALGRLDSAALDRLSADEILLSKRLAELDRERADLERNLPADSTESLRHAILNLAEPARGSLQNELTRVRRLAERVQEEASENWLSTYRIHRHVSDLLGVIAAAGRPTVGGRVAQGQGLMLDCNA